MTVLRFNGVQGCIRIGALADAESSDADLPAGGGVCRRFNRP